MSEVPAAFPNGLSFTRTWVYASAESRRLLQKLNVFLLASSIYTARYWLIAAAIHAITAQRSSIGTRTGIRSRFRFRQNHTVIARIGSVAVSFKQNYYYFSVTDSCIWYQQ